MKILTVPVTDRRMALDEMEILELLADHEIQFVDEYSDIDELIENDCKNYALGRDINTFPEGYVEVDVPEDGDIIVYYTDETSAVHHDAPLHYGVFVSDNIVRSKWGEYPVFEHRIEDAPLQYGNFVRFFRKAPAAVSVPLLHEFRE